MVFHRFPPQNCEISICDLREDICIDVIKRKAWTIKNDGIRGRRTVVFDF